MKYHTRHMSRRWITSPALAAITVLAGLAFTPTPAIAAPAGAAAASTDTALTPEKLLATQLAIQARKALQEPFETRDTHQAAQATILTDLALELAPRDHELWAQRASLAARAGDEPNLVNALRRYCTLVPTDDTAQWQLTQQLLARYQTLDQRIAAAVNLLDQAESAGLSKPLRSRLASSAAEGFLEVADTEQFGRLLTRAVELDPSNKHAAGMTYRWSLSSGAPPAQVGAAVLNLAKADPVDPHTRRELAEFLLSQGEYTEAVIQFRLAQRLAQARPDQRMVYGWALSLAASGDPDEALALLTEYERSIPAPAEEPAPAAATQPADAEAAPPPSLPTDLELLRLAILHQHQQGPRAKGSLGRLQAKLAPEIEAGNRDAAMQSAWLTLLLDDTAVKPDMLDALRAHDPDPAGLFGSLEGWLQLRANRPFQARDRFTAVRPGEPTALYGTAMSYDNPRDPQRLRLLNRLVASAPTELLGLLAADELATVGEEAEPTPAGAAAARVLDGWQDRIKTPDTLITPWLRVNLAVDPPRLAYLEPVTAKVTLTNATGFAYDLTEASFSPTQLSLYLTLRQGGAIVGRTAPLLVDLRRRLTIQPYETITAPVRIDRTELGALLTGRPFETYDFGVAAVLAMTAPPGPRGVVASSDHVHLVSRGSTQPSEEAIDLWLYAITGPDPLDRFAAAACLARLMAGLQFIRDLSDAQLDLATRIVEKLETYYQDHDPATRAWVVLMSTRDVPEQARLAGVLESAARSDDPLVRISYLATQVNDPASQELDDALRHADRRISRFAEARRNALLKARDAAAKAEQQAAEREAAAEAAAEQK